MPPLRPATVTAHAGLAADPQHGAVPPPLVPTSIYAHGNPGAYEYGREHNPVWERLEATLSALEAGAATSVFASGMAAIGAVLELVPLGARVLVPAQGYSGPRRLAAELNDAGRIAAVFVDIADTDAVIAAGRDAALWLLESVTNPLLTVPDLPACIAAGHAAGALVVVDSTFSTPLTLRPLELGADAVVHSLTKYAGGHSDLVLGSATVADAALGERMSSWRTAIGSIPGQLETWLCLRGLRTLDVRLRRQMESASAIAHRLGDNGVVERVHYPGLQGHPQHARAAAQLRGGFGAVVSFETSGGAERAEAVCSATRVWAHATSLGGVESTLERRARYELDAEIVPESLIRLSVGIEDVEDLWDDLDQALDSTDP